MPRGRPAIYPIDNTQARVRDRVARFRERERLAQTQTDLIEDGFRNIFLETDPRIIPTAPLNVSDSPLMIIDDLQDALNNLPSERQIEEDQPIEPEPSEDVPVPLPTHEEPITQAYREPSSLSILPISIVNCLPPN